MIGILIHNKNNKDKKENHSQRQEMDYTFKIAVRFFEILGKISEDIWQNLGEYSTWEIPPRQWIAHASQGCTLESPDTG